MQEILSNNTLRKTILITGATSGIGKALSKIYLENDWTVIGIGRDKTKIKEFSLDFPDNFYFYQTDLKSEALVVDSILPEALISSWHSQKHQPTTSSEVKQTPDK